MEAADQTDRAELERRFVAEMPRLRAFLQRLAGREQEAEDLLQESLQRAWRYRSSFDPRGSLRGWLGRVAFRTYLDRRAGEHRPPGPIEDHAHELAVGCGQAASAPTSTPCWRDFPPASGRCSCAST